MREDVPLLEVNGLSLDYMQGETAMRALDRVSFTLEKGEVLGVAGESGCGKSTPGACHHRTAAGDRPDFQGRDYLQGS